MRNVGTGDQLKYGINSYSYEPEQNTITPFNPILQHFNVQYWCHRTELRREVAGTKLSQDTLRKYQNTSDIIKIGTVSFEKRKKEKYENLFY